ncbi:MAG TPA: response regulator [Ignavibacteria bacterium]|jgi:PleD family two-component response regulator
MDESKTEVNTQPKKIKILVVDDDPQIRRLIKVTLQSKFNFEILEAENGLAALQKIEIEKPFLVMLDIMMPELNGIELIEKLKANEETKDVPIIICSAVNDRSRVIELFNKGVADYIVKPINPIILSNKITQYIKIYLDKIIKKGPVSNEKQ